MCGRLQLYEIQELRRRVSGVEIQEIVKYWDFEMRGKVGGGWSMPTSIKNTNASSLYRYQNILEILNDCPTDRD